MAYWIACASNPVVWRVRPSSSRSVPTNNSLIVVLCDALPHSLILEIGAEEGSILKRLSELGFDEELYALEISPTGVETIKKRGIPRLIECLQFNRTSPTTITSLTWQF